MFARYRGGSINTVTKTVFIATPLHHQTRNVRNVTSYYQRGVNFFFKKNLLLTNSITSGLFMFIGDMVQQEIEYSYNILSKRYDWERLGRMFIIGTAMGPFHHYYYRKLDIFLPKSDIKTVLQKVLCDQLTCGPLTLLIFYYGMGYLEHKTVAESTQEVKKKALYVYGGDCIFWPPIQMINFYYLPSMYRVVYINLATMVFNVFLSFMKHYDQH